MSGDRLYCTRSYRGGHPVVTAVGAVTRDTVIPLRTTLLQALTQQGTDLIVDLSGVEVIDDHGADALRRTHDRARLLGGGLRVVAGPQLQAQLRDHQLHWQLPIHPTLTLANHAITDDAPAGVVPVEDYHDQHQLADPDGDDDATSDAAVPVTEADPADVVDQHRVVPLDDDAYPADTPGTGPEPAT